MFKRFIDWLKSLFQEGVYSEAPPEFVEEVEQFAGWIKDEPDARDQIFGDKS